MAIFQQSQSRTAAPRRLPPRRGAALLVCIFVISMTTAMVVAMLDAETVNMSATRNTLDYERALYLAGAAVNHAVAELEADISWRTGVATTQFPAGSGNSYSVTAANGTGGTVIVTGQGVSGSVTRKLQITITPAS